MLVVGTMVGVLVTEGAQTDFSGSRQTAAQAAPVVDQKPVQTARKLALWPPRPKSRILSTRRLRLSDYEVDLAFADALREATEHPPAPTAEQRELTARAAKAEGVVKMTRT